MRVWSALILTASLGAGLANAAEEDFHVFTDSPRLLLTKQRLRLLQRERQRQSPRWQRLNELLMSGAAMPEAAVAQALDYEVSGDAAAARKAIDWAVSGATTGDSAGSLRQLALVFDWCGKAMTPAQVGQLAAKIQKALAAPRPDLPGQAARAMAAIAIADRLKDQGESILKPLVEEWWRGGLAKQLQNDPAAIPRSQMYSLLELLHVIRDNVQVDLRESVPKYFGDLPLDQLMGYYPAPFRGSDNDFMVPVFSGDANPDQASADWARAADLAMVALDTNAQAVQYLQGWLMQDRFMMRDPLGAVYEFLWADPYQPGLGYALLPLVFHSEATGDVFARTSWDEDATWIGYFGGHLQVFEDGKLQTMRAGGTTAPVRVGDAVLLSAPAARPDGTLRFNAATRATIVLGLPPRTGYDVEIDDEELSEGASDAGGALVVELPADTQAGVRIRPRP